MCAIVFYPADSTVVPFVPRPSAREIPHLVADRATVNPKRDNTLEKRLAEFAQKVSQCRKCDLAGIAVDHASAMRRGRGREIFAIGIEPGHSEIKEAEAFVGPAGKRLMSWLAEAGLGSDRDKILDKCYLTSLCKCNVKSKSQFRWAARNCFYFLEEQLQIVQPRICITLGLEPLKYLFEFRGSLTDVVGKAWREEELRQTLVPLLPGDCVILPLPHPSPLSRWVNDSSHRKMVSDGLATLKRHL